MCMLLHVIVSPRAASPHRGRADGHLLQVTH